MSYRRSIEDKRRLEKLHNETRNSYFAGAWYNEKKGRYVKYTCHDEWFKTYSRRIVRRKLKNNEDLIHGNSYKKIFDYKWTVT